VLLQATLPLEALPLTVLLQARTAI